MEALASPSRHAWPSRPVRDKMLRSSRLPGLQRSLPSSAPGAAQICVRGTFLQVVQTDGEDFEPASPTALSDPGSEVSNDGVRAQADHQSMELLNRRMVDWWSRTSRSDAASEQPAPGDESACRTELEQQQSCQPVESMPLQERRSHYPGPILLGHASANGSTTSRSSLSTWQGISEDVHETLLRDQLESADQTLQNSSVTLHQPGHPPEQLQYPLGSHTCHNQQSEQRQAHQSSGFNQGLAKDSSGCVQHALWQPPQAPQSSGFNQGLAKDSFSCVQHAPWQPRLLHVGQFNVPPELEVDIPQNANTSLWKSARFANMLEGAQMPLMGSAAAAQRPQDATASNPASQCDDVKSALSGIPEQIRQLLESTAHGVAEEVGGEVAAMGDVIRYSNSLKGATELAVEKLECIPGLILNSFEGKLTRVKDKVRRKVNNVIEDLEFFDHFKEEVVKKLYTIPEELVNIATEAMKEVSQDSQMLSAQQIDDALLSVPQACVENLATLHDMRSSIVASVPDASSSTSKAVHDTAIEAVAQAVAKICDTVACPANELVAVQLMRIKAGNEGVSASSGSWGMRAPAEFVTRQSSESSVFDLPETTLAATVGASLDAGMISSAVGSVTQASNPGSVGHPELCTRPCLYFARGQCMNENSCDFCHLPHPKRPSHLDKRHREMLKRMPLAESVSVAIPVLREKARSLSLGHNVMELLNKLEEVADGSLESFDCGTASSSRPLAKRSGRNRSLQGAMRGITLRSLLTALHRFGLPGDSSLRAALADLLRSLRSVAPDFLCDLNAEEVDTE